MSTLFLNGIIENGSKVITDFIEIDTNFMIRSEHTSNHTMFHRSIFGKFVDINIKLKLNIFSVIQIRKKMSQTSIFRSIE